VIEKVIHDDLLRTSLLTNQRHLVLLVHADQQLSHSTFANNHVSSHEHAPLAQSELEPGRREQGDGEETEENFIQIVAFPVLDVQVNAQHFHDCHDQWKDEQENVEVASAGDPRVDDLTRDRAVRTLDPDVE